MDHSEKVNHDAVLRARTMLLASWQLELGQQVRAYRVLSTVSPLTYLPKLAEALLSWGCTQQLRELPEARLALFAEAAETARHIDKADPKKTELLVRALNIYQRELFSLGREAEGLVIREEMVTARLSGPDRGQAYELLG